MISKFPKWVWFGGWALAFVAGIVNVIGLMHVHRQAITHLTGTTTMLSEAIARMDGALALHFAGLIASFLLGTVISGFLIEDTALKLSRPYGVALVLESAMLAGAAMWFVHGGDSGIYLASCACGLQNALVSTFSGAVIRTTHLSGMFTDLGIFLGHALRGRTFNILRMKLSFLVISAFFAGGIVGAIAFKAVGYYTLLLPSGLTGLAALGFGLNHLRERRSPGSPV